MALHCEKLVKKVIDKQFKIPTTASKASSKLYLTI
jgi:hypothetical protein